MGVCADVYKECPKCDGRGHMQLRTSEAERIDLDNVDELLANRSVTELRQLHAEIEEDGDPFVCSLCGLRFRLNHEMAVKVATMLFAVNPESYK